MKVIWTSILTGERCTEVDRFEIYFGDKINGVFWKLDIEWWWNEGHIGLWLEKIDVRWSVFRDGK